MNSKTAASFPDTQESHDHHAVQESYNWAVPTQESVGTGHRQDDEDMCTSPSPGPTQESSGQFSIPRPLNVVDQSSTESDIARLHAYHNNMLTYSNVSPVQGSDAEEITHYDIGPFPGYASLMCNDRIPEHSFPLCVETDIDLMSSALRNCNWEVEKFLPNPSPCMTQHQCKAHMSSLLDKDYSNYSGFIVYYSGHGDSKGLLLQDGSSVPYADIVQKVSSINSLDGKPKIFIFDSCRVPVGPPKKIFWNFSWLFHKVPAENEGERNYLPSDTLICFSTNEGMEGWSEDHEGSFYTRELAKKVSLLWEKLSFTEIVTLAHGWTSQLAQQFEKQQQPVMYNALSKLLLLGGCHMALPKQHQCTHSKQSSHVAGNTYRSKGPTVEESPENDVVTDAIGKRVEFKTKDDVTNNLHRLGQGITVFVCYTPDPESPYYDPKDRGEVIAHNQRQIISLIHDLEQCGFTVISDLHLGNTQPSNWLMWYVSRIELCDFLVMVCSPSFKELFSRVELKGKIIDERSSWFRTYCASIYSEIHKEGKKSAFCSKFLPVILDDRFSVDDCIPTLLAAGSNYQLKQSSPRKFKYDSNGEWEQLVCRMAGIDRNKLNAPTDKGIHQLAAPYGSSSSGPNVTCPRPRKGHKVVRWVPSPSSEQQSLPPAKRVASSTHVLPSQAPCNPPPSQHPTPSQTPPPPQPVQRRPQPTELPKKPPAHTVILWLCDNITDWKFFARYLKMDNSEIEKIAADHCDSIREQRYHMFESWKRHEWSEYTYRTLGDVLLKSESNRRLYDDFFHNVMQAEHS